MYIGSILYYGGVRGYSNPYIYEVRNMGSSNVSGVMVALMVTLLVVSLGTGYLTYRIYSNEPKTVTVTTTVTTPSVTEVTKTYTHVVIRNETVVTPVTLTKTEVVVVNNTVTAPPITIPVTHTVIQTATETVTQPVTVTQTVTHIENTVMYGGETFLNLLRNANKSIYLMTYVPRYVLDVIRALGDAKARGIEVKLVVFLPDEDYIKDNLNGERDVIQLIIDLGLTNSTRIDESEFVGGAVAVIDGKYLAITDLCHLAPGAHPMIIRNPPEPLLKVYLGMFSDDYLNMWFEPLMKYLERKKLLQYFNIPSS